VQGTRQKTQNKKKVEKKTANFQSFFEKGEKYNYPPIKVLFNTLIKMRTQEKAYTSVSLFLAQVEAMQNRLSLRDIEEFIEVTSWVEKILENFPDLKCQKERIVNTAKGRIQNMLNNGMIHSLNEYPRLRELLEKE
jgi:hypothetical protein